MSTRMMPDSRAFPAAFVRIALGGEDCMTGERLYTKRPGIASCRFDGIIRELLWLGHSCAQCTSRWRPRALLLPHRPSQGMSNTSGEHRTAFLKTEFAPFARHPMDICGSALPVDSRDLTAFVSSSTRVLTRPP